MHNIAHAAIGGKDLEHNDVWCTDFLSQKHKQIAGKETKKFARQMS
jgi:hypothetical protein